MRVIQIQESRVAADGSNAKVCFDSGLTYPVTVMNPFSDEDDQLLEWYFEQYLQFPFVRGVDARKASDSINIYGEALFTQVFSSQEAITTYQHYAQAGLDQLSIEIVGSPEFQTL